MKFLADVGGNARGGNMKIKAKGNGARYFYRLKPLEADQPGPDLEDV